SPWAIGGTSPTDCRGSARPRVSRSLARRSDLGLSRPTRRLPCGESTLERSPHAELRARRGPTARRETTKDRCDEDLVALDDEYREVHLPVVVLGSSPRTTRRFGSFGSV